MANSPADDPVLSPPTPPSDSPSSKPGPLNAGDQQGLEGLAKLALVPLVADAPRPPVGERLPRSLHYGPPGAASTEQACGSIHVYMRSIGNLMEKRRALLRSEHTVADARSAFQRLSGSAPLPDDTRDESGFLISGDELKLPLWRFSSGCNLNLNFTHPVALSLEQPPEGQGASSRNVFI